MIKVLHVVSGLGSGGVESLLYNYYKYINKDEIQFDFITHRPPGLYEEKLLAIGKSKFYHISFRKKHPLRSAFEAYRIFKGNNYDIIHFHGHLEVCIQLFAAFIAGKKVRIIHFHNPIFKNNKLKRFFNKILNIYFSIFATDFLASSNLVIETVFGGNKLAKNNCKIMKNAIDVESYIFNNALREQKRKEFGLKGKFVIGNIGRFTYQKNHSFLIDIFLKIHHKNKDAVLLLIGEGEDKGKVEQKVKELGLEKEVKFLGVRSDISELMHAMDIFLFPSKFEGLGIVLIEAQASGLQCIASEKVIPTETNITEFINYLSLEESSEYWANALLNYSEGYKRRNTSEQVKKAGYDLKIQASWLENYYRTRG